MARTAGQIIVDIRSFQPTGGNWRALDDLLAELWTTGKASRHITDLLAVLERFPGDDGAGVLWSVVHGIETLRGYESELVLSVRRQPSELGVSMVGRLLNGGVSHVGDTSLVSLLREVAASAAVISCPQAAIHTQDLLSQCRDADATYRTDCWWSSTTYGFVQVSRSGSEHRLTVKSHNLTWPCREDMVWSVKGLRLTDAEWIPAPRR